MRDQSTVLSLIIDTAKADDRIRAACLHGSRVNPSLPADPYQDYDLSYYVTEIESFAADTSWISVFGELLILQMPHAMDLGQDYPDPPTGTLTYLMRFRDHVRIDLTLRALPVGMDTIDSLTEVLYDADGHLTSLPSPSERDYLTARPTEAQFHDCCNEFWWVSTYVAKGLLREELLYAKDMLEGPVRRMLLRLIAWRVAARNGFTVNMGRSFRFLPHHLDEWEYHALLSTYPGASLPDIRQALFHMTLLFDRYARDLSRSLQFTYHEAEARNVRDYLANVLSF